MTQNSKSPGDPRLRWVHKFVCTIVSNKTSFFYGVPKTKLLTAYLVYRLEPLVWLAGWSHLPDILVLNGGMENTFDNCSSFWKTVKNNTTHSSVKVCASTRRSRPSQAAASISINFSPAPVIITLNRAVHPTLLLLPSPSPQPLVID